LTRDIHLSLLSFPFPLHRLLDNMIQLTLAHVSALYGILAHSTLREHKRDTCVPCYWHVPSILPVRHCSVYAKVVTKSRKLRWKTCSTQGEMMHSRFVWMDWKDAFRGIDWRLGLNTTDAFLPSYNLPIHEFAWFALSPILLSDTDCNGK